ncbi:MAG: hypothetical protein RLZZ323_424 [Bacteroidota bacterium]|jgi:hypothetical protein
MKFNKIKLCNNVIIFLFVLGLISDISNDLLFDNCIPTKVIDYFFWFTFGLYIGFNLFKWGIYKHRDSGIFN